MAPSERAGKSVFCGNIPYNLTEEQVKEILSTAGAVERFRLMVNPETGRPKGYGFADFADADSAASAVRNLNDYEIMGRKIRVDWPHNNEKDSVPPDYSQLPGYAQNQDRSQMHQSSTTLPPLPPGSEIPAGLTCPDAISRTLAALPAPSLLDVLNQMKALVMSDPARATELLRQAPQLAYAIFQALLLMNLVDQSALASVVERTAQPVVAAPPPPAPQAQPFAPYPGSVPTPPVQQPYMAPQAPAAEVPLENLSPAELLQRVLAMPQSAVDALPPGDREQVIALRAAYMR